MSDVRAIEVAGRQHGRIAVAQLREAGLSRRAIEGRLARGLLVLVEPGVCAFAPVLDDPRGRWMAATLTARGTVLSHVSAAAAHGMRPRPEADGRFEVVTRPGSGGPCRHGGVLVHRSTTLAGETTTRFGVPITTVERTLLDLVAHLGDAGVGKALREAIRLRLTTAPQVIAFAAERPRRRGARRLTRLAVRLLDLPLARSRSDAESLAVELIAAAGRPAPDLNRRVAGVEADLSWPEARLIVEVDGPQFHLFAADDRRRQAVWEAAGWTVRRLPSGDVFDAPHRLLALVPPSGATNVANAPAPGGAGDVRGARERSAG